MPADPRAAALDSLRTTIATDARDWSATKRDAWIYGIVIGWGDALPEVSALHGWTASDEERLLKLRALLAAPPAPVVTWSKTPPTAKDAAEVSRWWWVRFVLPSGAVAWCTPEDFSFAETVARFALVPPMAGHHEFLPCRPEAPAPGGEVAKADRDAAAAFLTSLTGLTGWESLNRAAEVFARIRVLEAVRAALRSPAPAPTPANHATERLFAACERARGELAAVMEAARSVAVAATTAAPAPDGGLVDKCPACHGKGEVDAGCRYCGDSTYDHECETRMTPCLVCKWVRDALAAASGSGKGAT